MTSGNPSYKKDLQYLKFCLYGFFKNLRFFEPFLILFLLESGMSYLQIGVLYSIREGARYLLEIPAGMLADALGRRKTMIASFIFYILSFLLFYFGPNYSVFILAMVLYASGDAFRTGTHKAMIFDYLKIRHWENHKVNYYGHTRSWSQMGSAISALLAAVFVFYSGSYRSIFLWAIIPYLADLILLTTYPKALDGKVSGESKTSRGNTMKKVWADFIESFRNPVLVRSIANLSVFTGYYKSVKDYLQILIQSLALSLPFFLGFEDKQRTATLIGIIYFFIYLLSSFSSRNSARISQRLKTLSRTMNLTLLLGFIVGILAGWMFTMHWMGIAIIFFVLIYIIENVRKPVGISYISETANTDILATLLSAESQAHTLIAVILAPLIGWFSDLWGIGIALSLVSLVLLLSTPLYQLRRNNKKVLQ